MEEGLVRMRWVVEEREKMVGKKREVSERDRRGSEREGSC